MRDRLVEKTYHWDLRASPDALWPILSDTARLNEALDQPAYRIAETFDRDSLRRRYGEMDEDGVRVRWEEPHFEWAENGWWRWRRFYDDGPLRETGGILMVEAVEAGGSRLTYTLTVEPNGTLGRMLVASGHLKVAAEAFESIARRADDFCAKPHGEFFSNLAAEKVSERRRTKRLPATGNREDDKLLAQLTAWLAVAPLADRQALRSKRLARCLGISEADSLRVCLLAVDGEVLQRRYRAVCPSCRASSIEASQLSDLADVLACRRCGAGYQRDLAGTVEALFVDPKADKPPTAFCGSGPATMPHIAIQQNVGALERRDLVSVLAPGPYIARAIDGSVSKMITLPAKSGVRALLTESGLSLEPLGGASVLENHTKRPFTIAVERCEWPEDALPVSDLLMEPAFRDLAPEETLPVGETSIAGRGAILHAFDIDAATVAFERGAVCFRAQREIAAVFSVASDAVAAAEDLCHRNPGGRFAVDCGPLNAAGLFGGFSYTGAVPDTARALSENGPIGMVQISARVDEELSSHYREALSDA